MTEDKSNIQNASLMSRTVKGISWAFGSSSVQAIIQLIGSIFLARMLDPRDFGLQGMAMIIIAFGLMASQMGLGPALIQRSEITSKHIITAYTSSIIFGSVLLFGVYSLAPILAGFFNESELNELVKALSIMCLLGAVNSVPISMLQRELRFKELFYIESISSAIGFLIVGIILAYL